MSREEIKIVLSDRWTHLTAAGLAVGSPDVGFTSVELCGTRAQWREARLLVVRAQMTATGAARMSATRALRNIDAVLR